MHLTYIEKFIIFFIALILIFTFANRITRQVESPTKPAQKTIAALPLTLEIDLPTFQQKYNSQIAQYDIPALLLQNPTIKIEKDKKIFYQYLDISVILSGEIDINSNKISKIAVSSDPNKVGKAGKQAVLLQAVVFDSAIAVINPTLNRDERAEILKKLSYKTESHSVNIGNITYQTRIYNGLLMLSIKPKKT